MFAHPIPLAALDPRAIDAWVVTASHALQDALQRALAARGRRPVRFAAWERLQRLNARQMRHTLPPGWRFAWEPLLPDAGRVTVVWDAEGERVWPTARPERERSKCNTCNTPQLLVAVTMEPPRQRREV